MSDEGPKKKRRQNVACDSCKLRRIKCDLLQLLTTVPSTSASSSTDDQAPLNELVLQHPDVFCTHCKNKGLRCTTNQIVNPSKPNKGGKRIDEARRTYGAESIAGVEGESRLRNEYSETSSTSQHPIPVDHPVNASVDPVQRGSIAPTWDDYNFLGPNPIQHHAALPIDDSNDQYIFDTLLATFTEPDSSTWTERIPTPASNPFQPSAAKHTQTYNRYEPNFPIVSLTAQHSTDTPVPTSTNTFGSPQTPHNDLYTPAPGTQSDPACRGNYDQAASIWWRFANDPQDVMRIAKQKGDKLDETALGIDQLVNQVPALKIYDRLANTLHEMAQSDPMVSLYTEPTPAKGASKSTSLRSPTPSTPRSDHSSVTESQRYAASRKRPRSISLDPREVGSIELMNGDSWRFWAEEGATFRWGRREVVQEKLADRVLGQALSRHLVKTYFQSVHLSYPAINPESFYLEWARAGQRSDRMTPAQEVLCATIEAWGARYSDSPVVLGLDPNKSSVAPKVIQSNGTFTPGTQARAHWGRARTTVCRALVNRARQLIDANGILRQPSITGVQALTLYTQMMHMTDQKDLGKDHFMQSQMLHSAMLDQMKLLGLMWNSQGPIITDDDEMPMNISTLRMKQRRLFWSQMVADAFFAASMGQLPKIEQEDVDAAGDWIQAVQNSLPHSSFKALAFFLSCYHRYGVLGREIAIKLSAPGQRKGSLDVWSLCTAIRRIWFEVNEIAHDINTQTITLLANAARDDLFGFSPLNYFTNLRLCGPFLLLLIHQIVREQLGFRKALHPAYITTPADGNSPSSTSAQSKEVEMLEQLSRESVDTMLKTCRAQIGMYKDTLPTGLMQTASIFIRMLMATSQLLAEVPTVEQGYPSNTPGGHGWTWEVKQKEVNVCIDGLYQVVTWGDIGEVLDDVMVTMERMTPTQEELDAWRMSRPQPDGLLTRRADEEDRTRGKAMQTVLSFWPPISVSTLIEEAMKRESGSDLESSMKNVARQLDNLRSHSPAQLSIDGSSGTSNLSRPTSTAPSPQDPTVTATATGFSSRTTYPDPSRIFAGVSGTTPFEFADDSIPDPGGSTPYDDLPLRQGTKRFKSSNERDNTSGQSGYRPVISWPGREGLSGVDYAQNYAISSGQAGGQGSGLSVRAIGEATEYDQIGGTGGDFDPIRDWLTSEQADSYRIVPTSGFIGGQSSQNFAGGNESQDGALSDGPTGLSGEIDWNFTGGPDLEKFLKDLGMDKNGMAEGITGQSSDMGQGQGHYPNLG
ncbi:hypothetical protein IAR55_001235 [Kwoniella newhampshirensis]|uniref:Zn(2)-C6 fungal-type domain-containing protein n=1 Tax=Kwoniella newhampshirensis TaxID=1651941 RepID=A0AAW0Z567_9TREE